MSKRSNILPLLTALVLVAGFIALVWWSPPGKPRLEVLGEDRVVLPAPVQVFLAAGDRYLAANIENFRAMSSGTEANLPAEREFRLRSFDTASQLNPCHEDNYYVANAILTWGGAPEHGIDILRRATHCRSWDYSPPFFLGLAQNSFLHDPAKARASLELAATRASSEDQASSLHRIGVMMEAGSYQSTAASLAFLRHEMEATHDQRLKAMLEKRVQRMEGLQLLEQAQAEFEQKTGRPLQAPDELLSSGVLQAFPSDPMRLGYEFEDGHFRLRSTD
ncbi:hypothetical protein [Lampropedia aestuarii]|uniref:hypothetical protein n=1 Tax=Lampropedia aestuarii TaxID=2562762 RepID=UPI002468DA9E|nr:hypothetical protein [Lampropedia aestuarii]MDH5856682.1 hypothetical protein [Lampropedia aestuarii]